MRHTWVTIEAFPHYAVSSEGEVINLKTRRELKQTDNNGYLRVSLSDRGYQRDFYVHLLVAEAFIEGYNGLYRVRHANGDTHDNSVYNLKLSKGIRVINRFDHEPVRWGRRVRLVEANKIYDSVYELADDMGMHASAIYRCLRGQVKSHHGYHFQWVDK